MNNHLTESDLEAVILESKGFEFKNEAQTKTYDHIDEVRNGYRSLVKMNLEKSLKNPNLKMKQKKILLENVEKSNHYMNRIEKIFFDNKIPLKIK